MVNENQGMAATTWQSLFALAVIRVSERVAWKNYYTQKMKEKKQNE